MIFSAMIMGRVVKFLKLPNVTGYLIAGLLIGPSLLNIIPIGFINSTTIISDIALAFIAFSIGNEFKMSYFKKVGAAPIIIAILEATIAVVLVVGGLLAIGCDLPFALILGAIAAATAPAATVMVIRQYKSKGSLTETLLAVVAIDDAVALILYGVAVAVVENVGNASGSLISTIIAPLIEIGGSLIIGFALGLLMTYSMRWFKKESNQLCLTTGFVFAGAGIATMLNLSPLLLEMAIGAALINFSKSSSSVMKITDSVTPPIFMLFFVISGAGLNLSILPSIGVVGITYVVLRVVGKMLGATLGAYICHCDDTIKKYLGMTLVPQAGVAIGLSLAAATVVPQHAESIRAVVLCATLIYELVGPALAKYALQKAGNIQA